MTNRKPKIGERVVWQSEDGPQEFGTITQVSPSGQRIEVQWDNPPEFYEIDATFIYDFSPASGVRLVHP